MAKAGRRARARVLAMARAAARRRLQQQQDAAAAREAARRKSTIEELPADILGVLFGCLGFHASLAASHASKTLHKAPDAATRARHRLTGAAPRGGRRRRTRASRTSGPKGSMVRARRTTWSLCRSLLGRGEGQCRNV